MIEAYVLIDVVDDANPSEIASEIMLLEEVDNLHLIYGEWDMIAQVKTEDMSKLRNFSLNKLLKMAGIAKTNTLIIADE